MSLVSQRAAHPRPLRVCCFPLSVSENSILGQLYGPMADKPLELLPYRWLSADLFRADIFHVHWPDAVVMGRSDLKCLLKAIAFLLSIVTFALRGCPIIYHVHNIGSHDKTRPRLERLMWRVFLPRVTVFVHMNAASIAQLHAKWPVTERGRHTIIRLPHYRAEMSSGKTKSDARKVLGLPADAYIFLTFGIVRPYKGTELIISAFKSMENPAARLIIIGRSWTEDYGEEIRLACEGDDRIIRLDTFVEQDVLNQYLIACDVVVIAHRAVNNSSVALMALSADRQLIAPRIGALPELQELAGGEWVHLFDELTPSVLNRALKDGRSLPDDSAPNLAAFEPAAVAAQLLELYELVASRPGRPL